MFQVLVESVDRTSYIKKNTLQIENILTSQVDSASFVVQGKDWMPARGNEIIINFQSETIFGGRVIDVKKTDRIFLEVEVQCQDYSADLDRKRIAKVYENMSAKSIIEDIIDTVNTETGMTFTTNNVSESTIFSKVVFNYLEVSKCIESLADALNWHWYVDHEKDIHFFARGDKISPFSVTDESPNVIRETLSISESLSELRNVVVLRGGEFVGNERSEAYVSDGEQKTINLSYKFAKLPIVTVNSTPITIGVENLDNDDLENDLFVALWDYNQKYLRFKTEPNDGDVIESTGNPLFPLIILAEDPDSIEEFGVKEHLIEDNSIKSINYGIERAVSELDAYAQGVKSGEFITYANGLRSGQMISVESDKLNVSELFLIRSVRITEFGLNSAQFEIELVNNRVLGVIEILQKLLLKDKKRLSIDENEVPNIIKLDNKVIYFNEEVSEVAYKEDHHDAYFDEEIRGNPFEAEFVIANYFPLNDSDPKTPMRIGISSFIYPDP